MVLSKGLINLTTPLGSSDHNIVHLLPTYKSVLQRERRVDIWSDESSLALQGCFDCADWSVFQDSSDDIHELTDALCSYIQFCKDTVIPSMKVKVYPNNKPRVSSELKNVISQRNAAFNCGNVLKVKEL